MYQFLILITLFKCLKSETVEILMPNATTQIEDAYLCTSYKLEFNQTYITNFKALTNSAIAHHMIVYGCEQPTSLESIYQCPHSECQGYKTILFAWGRNAPELKMPTNVSFNVNRSVNIKYIVVNVHYLNKVNNDQSGLSITFTNRAPKYEAGIILLVSGYIAIPPHTKSYTSDLSCLYSGRTLNVFAYRVHAHEHGDVNSAYRIRNNSWTQMAKGDPQLPQTFYKTDLFDIKDGDMLVGRCVYHNDENRTVYAGQTHNDEMCNVYLMYYTDDAARVQQVCFGSRFPHLERLIPSESLEKPDLTDQFGSGEAVMHHMNHKKVQNRRKRHHIFSG